MIISYKKESIPGHSDSNVFTLISSKFWISWPLASFLWLSKFPEFQWKQETLITLEALAPFSPVVHHLGPRQKSNFQQSVSASRSLETYSDTLGIHEVKVHIVAGHLSVCRRNCCIVVDEGTYHFPCNTLSGHYGRKMQHKYIIQIYNNTSIVEEEWR